MITERLKNKIKIGFQFHFNKKSKNYKNTFYYIFYFNIAYATFVYYYISHYNLINTKLI